MPRSLCRSAAALTLGVALVACGNEQAGVSDAATSPDGGDPGEQVTLTFESFNYGTDGAAGEGMQQLIDEFEAAHPNITIEPVGTPAGEIHTSVQLQAAAGDPPDVAQIGWSKFSFVLENLPYTAVEEIAPPDDWAAHLDGLTPAATSIGTHDDITVGVPFNVSTPTMLYNADIFEAAGLDPDDPPATWEEVQGAALAITESTDDEGVYVAAVDPAKSDYLTQSLVYSNGGQILTDDGDVAFDDPPAVEAMAMLQDLTETGAQPRIGTADALALMESGDLGMFVVSTAVLGALATTAEGNYDLRTAPLPSFGSQPVRPTYSGGGLFVLTDDPDEQAAAWEFVQFLTGDRGTTIVTSKIGYLPLRPALLEDPEHLAPFISEDPRILPTVHQMENLHPYLDMPGPDGSQAREILQDAVEAIVLGGADPGPTLEQAADRVAELLS